MNGRLYSSDEKERWNRTCSAAVDYANMGLHVFPLWSVDESGKCLCGEANCDSPGKHPHPLAPHGFKNATRDGNLIASWFDHGPLNVGIRTGSESGIVVLDVDYRHGGNESIKKFAIPEQTPRVKTGGGLHYYFRHPGGYVKSLNNAFATGLDCKGDGGYVVAPPSMHPCGQKYRWLIDPRGGFPDMPKWMSDGKAKKNAAGPLEDDAPIHEGQRNTRLTSIAGAMRRQGMDADDVLEVLQTINAKRCKPPLDDKDLEKIATSVAKYKPAEAKSQATCLVDLAKDVDLFHDADGKAYATIPVDGHRETWPTRSKWFRRWLTGEFWRKYQKAPGNQATEDALRVLESKAVYDGSEESVRVRLADHDGATWLDLANCGWDAVMIAADGWKVVSNPPVKFLRPRGLSSLPRPALGGDINILRQFVNVGSDADWALMVSWLVAAFSPRGPYPILEVGGEQGSAKSTLCRLIRAIIDPNSASLRAMPGDGRDLVIAASNSWIMAFDNISTIPGWLSDAFCRMATGGGFATRELYSDNEEIIFDVMRPVMLNGICELATRSDLLDRSICITLPTIPDSKRMTERELWSRFAQSLPKILGAVLSAVSIAMKQLPFVTLPNPPRMADFATLAVAAEGGLGLEPGSFLSAYARNRGQASDFAIEASVIGEAILEFMEGRNCWEGTAKELLTELGAEHSPEQAKNRRDWPSTPQAVGIALRRIAPNLRQAGINVQFDRGKGKRRKRLIVLEKSGIPPSEMSEPSDQGSDAEVADVVSDMSDVSDNDLRDDSHAPGHEVEEADTDD